MVYVAEKALSDELCDTLVKEFHQHTWYIREGVCGEGKLNNMCPVVDADEPITKLSTDITVFGSENPNKNIEALMNTLFEHTQNYIKEFVHFEKANPPIKFDDGFNMQWYKPGEGFFAWHSEKSPYYNERCLAWMFNLNDVEEGGGTEFKYFPNAKIDARKGQLTIFPAYVSHLHRGIVAPKEDKYIATGWFSYERPN
jgi:hypothetical protein